MHREKQQGEASDEKSSFVSSVAFGYKSHKQKKLIVDRKAANVIARIFALGQN